VTHDIVEISAATAARLQPFEAGMALDVKLHLLATNGGQFLVKDDFAPNGGKGVVPYPRMVAPVEAIEAHMGNNQRKGRIVVLPLSFAQEECERAGLDLHVSNVSVANKPDAEPAIGRLISDYSHPEGASMMFAGKKSLNKHVFTPIRNPTAADVCQLHANAMAAFPGEVIVAARLDISSAYNRIRLHPPSIPLGALYFRGADGVEYVAMPMVEWFGSQDSNFHWQLVAVDLAGRSSHRCQSRYGCALSAMYTDDFFLFGTREFVEAESARFSADAESAVGVGAINVKKTVSGSHIDIIGLANDTSAAHTIGMSATIFLKMVCAMFVMMPLELEAGDVISV
jgi:hypothetical protein